MGGSPFGRHRSVCVSVSAGHIRLYSTRLLRTFPHAAPPPSAPQPPPQAPSQPDLWPWQGQRGRQTGTSLM